VLTSSPGIWYDLGRVKKGGFNTVNKVKERLVTCNKCGESGIFAGGLRKVDDGIYECNNSTTCGTIKREKDELLASRKEVSPPIK
jgi:hypothetical protein